MVKGGGERAGKRVLFGGLFRQRGLAIYAHGRE